MTGYVVARCPEWKTSDAHFHDPLIMSVSVLWKLETWLYDSMKSQLLQLVFFLFVLCIVFFC